VALRVDVIVALFTPCALAAKRATNEIPIVFLAGDAVGLGIVHCLVDDADDASSFDVCP